MKIKNRFLPVLLCSLALFIGGCDDPRMDDMAVDKVYVSNFGESQQNIYKWDNYTYSLPIIKSGMGQQGGKVSLGVDETILAQYGTKYTLLPADLYKIKSTSLTLSASDYVVPFEIEMNVPGVEALQLANPKLIYAVPFKISSSDIQTASENELFTVFIPKVLDPYIEFKTAGLSPATASISLASSPAETRFFSFLKTNYDNKADLKYTVEVSAASLDAYNLEMKTTHKLLPAEAYRLDANSFTIANLNNEQALSYYLINGKVPNGDYMLPLKISTVAKYGINPLKSTTFIPVKIQN